MGSTRFDALNRIMTSVGTRRTALRWLAATGGVIATVRAGTRSAGAAQNGAGLTRAEARVLAEGIASALTEDPNRLDEWVSEDVVGHIPLSPEGSGKGIAGLKEKAFVIVDAIPDAKITVDGLAIDGDMITAHGEIYGTHTGTLAVIQATGRPVRVQYVIFTRVEGGKVAEYWYQLDVLGALQQLDMFSLDQFDEDEGY